LGRWLRVGAGWLLLLLLPALLGGCEPAGARTGAAIATPDPAVDYGPAVVAAAEYFPTFQHNVVDLRGRVATGGAFAAGFLAFFKATGETERWGRPLSEVFEERPGLLAQYFENGVLEYAPGFGVRARALWETLGAGEVEGRPLNEHDGRLVGRWLRRVSNVSVEGLATGFLDLFDRVGGVAGAGNPVSEARHDNHSEARLTFGPAQTGPIRQYFEAGVMQVWGGEGRVPFFLPLGRALRDRLYPGRDWMGLRVFLRTAPLAAGAEYAEVYLEHAGAEVAPVAEGDGVRVGRVGHAYALAYHPERHLLYRPGDGWYAFYFDTDAGVLAYSKDGVTFAAAEVVTEGQIGMGVSMFEQDEWLYLLYTDSVGATVYVQPVAVSGGEVRVRERIVAMEGDRHFSTQLPNIAFDAEGRPWVVARSYGSTSEGEYVDIWISHATDSSMQEWTERWRVSTDEEALRGAAGTSGSLAFVDEGVVIVFPLYEAGEMAGYSGDYRAVEGLAPDTAGEFAGTHDYILMADGDRAHLAYHRPAGGVGDDVVSILDAGRVLVGAAGRGAGGDPCDRDGAGRAGQRVGVLRVRRDDLLPGVGSWRGGFRAGAVRGANPGGSGGARALVGGGGGAGWGGRSAMAGAAGGTVGSDVPDAGSGRPGRGRGLRGIGDEKGRSRWVSGRGRTPILRGGWSI
jgi:hypothetical protein